MGKRLKKIDSYALTVVAISALAVSIWQVNLQRRHDRLSVKPYLQFITETLDDGYLRLKLRNKGSGVAILTRYYIGHQDTNHRSWRKAFASIDTSMVMRNEISFGRYNLVPNEDLTLMEYKPRKLDTANLKYYIEFESIYEEKDSTYLIAPY